MTSYCLHILAFFETTTTKSSHPWRRKQVLLKKVMTSFSKGSAKRRKWFWKLCNTVTWQNCFGVFNLLAYSAGVFHRWALNNKFHFWLAPALSRFLAKDDSSEELFSTPAPKYLHCRLLICKQLLPTAFRLCDINKGRKSSTGSSRNSRTNV